MQRRTERFLLLIPLVIFIVFISNIHGNHNPLVPSLLPNSRLALFTYGPAHRQPITLNNLEPANSTLGFGAIAAVSKDGSPRREGLLAAANITEIDIHIPTQPSWTETDLRRLYAEHHSELSRGSALAWLGHLNTLRWFLSTDLETVLIFEDDVDWDIHLRTVQVPTAAAAIRRLTSATSDPAGPSSYVDYDPTRNNYWGNTSAWDVLYLGHCGDIFHPDAWTRDVARVVYHDATLPPYPHLHPFSARFLQTIHVPSGSRVVHQSIFPLCTFGVALTRPAAARLLHEVAAREADGGTVAYDVRVLEACRDFGFRCWSVNPELFHHIEAESMIADVDRAAVAGEDHGADGVVKPPLRSGATINLACPVRSPQFLTQDPETMAFLREEVGRKGRCFRDAGELAAARGAAVDQVEEESALPDGWQDPRAGAR